MTDPHESEIRPRRKAASIAADLVSAVFNSNNRTPSGAKSTMGSSTMGTTTIASDFGEHKNASPATRKTLSSKTFINPEQNSSKSCTLHSNESPRVDPISQPAIEAGNQTRLTRSQSNRVRLASRLKNSPAQNESNPQVPAAPCSAENTFAVAEPRVTTLERTAANLAKVSGDTNLIALVERKREISDSSPPQETISQFADSPADSSEPAGPKNSILLFAKSLIRTFTGGTAKSNSSSESESKDRAIEASGSPNSNSQFGGIEKSDPQGALLKSGSESASTPKNLADSLCTTNPVPHGDHLKVPIAQFGEKTISVQATTSTQISAPQVNNNQTLSPQTDSTQVQTARKTIPQVIIDYSPTSNLSSSPLSSLKSSTPSPPAFTQERETEVPLIKRVGKNQIAQKRKMEETKAAEERGRQEKRKDRPDENERESKKQKVSTDAVLESRERGDEAPTDDDATISDDPTPVKENSNTNNKSVGGQGERRSSRERRPGVPRGASPVSRTETAPSTKLATVWTPLARSTIPNTPLASTNSLTPVQSSGQSRAPSQNTSTPARENGTASQLPREPLNSSSLTTPQSQSQSQYQLTQSRIDSSDQTSAREPAQSEAQVSPRPTVKPRSAAGPRSRVRRANTDELPSTIRKKAARERNEAREAKPSPPEQSYEQYETVRPQPQPSTLPASQGPPRGQKRTQDEAGSQPNPAANSMRGTSQVQREDGDNANSAEARILAQVHSIVTPAHPHRYEDIEMVQYINERNQAQRRNDVAGIKNLLNQRHRGKVSTAPAPAPANGTAPVNNTAAANGTSNTRASLSSSHTGGAPANNTHGYSSGLLTPNSNLQRLKSLTAQRIGDYDSGDSLGLLREAEHDLGPLDGRIDLRSGDILGVSQNSASSEDDTGKTWSLLGPLSIPGYSEILPPTKETDEPEANTLLNLREAAAQILNSSRAEYGKPVPNKEKRDFQFVISDLDSLAVGQLQHSSNFYAGVTEGEDSEDSNSFKDFCDGEFSMFERNDEPPLDEQIDVDENAPCVFCAYPCDYGVSDERVLLPVEALPGFCNGCHADSAQFFDEWRLNMKLKLYTEEARSKGQKFIRDLDHLPCVPFESAKKEGDFIRASEEITGRKIFGSEEERQSNGGQVAADVPRIVNGGGDVTSYQAIQTCRGNPWGQVDCRKATICQTCLTQKLDIIKHRRHNNFLPIEIPNKSNPEADLHAEPIERPLEKRRCMICTSHAVSVCSDCPLRVCGDCEGILSYMSKGELDLLFYVNKRRHLRNDAFLLRSDGGGF